jgi:diadenylate cyclase
MPLPLAYLALPLPNLTLTGAIDILVVGFLVYEALSVVRGTRAGHIVLGIVMGGLLYAAAVWARLEALRTVLSYIVPYTALAVIVLFQSEIRRTLARVGRRRWWVRGFRRPESTDEILLAINRLSQEKVGGLIVMERDIGLRTFIESGVPVDGRLSRDLLLAVFFPGSALHDGAVIVQKNRVAAAACFLPLSTNPALSSKLGTRHRAAIGITEETDCLSLVVSEVSGRISVAAFGEIEQGLTLREVDERINAHFGAKHAGPRLDQEEPADIPMTPETPGEKVKPQ